ncbi:biotin/lipoyl-containing protein [Segatella sp.]|uniref:biotin/lipoyl-containing protein n=1 Tax=Segatella sp. TaxID=2974253 RepID=UPI003077721A
MAKYEYKVKGVDYVVEIQDIEGNIANVTVNGIPFEVEMKQPVKSSKQKVKLSDVQNNISASSVASAGSAAGSSSAASSDSASSSKQATPAAGKPVVAPLPGTINEIKVKVGDKVNTGDTVVVLEAMKMQNNIDAETSGTITSINVNKGDAVMEGDTLVTIA